MQASVPPRPSRRLRIEDRVMPHPVAFSLACISVNKACSIALLTKYGTSVSNGSAMRRSTSTSRVVFLRECPPLSFPGRLPVPRTLCEINPCHRFAEIPSRICFEAGGHTPLKKPEIDAGFPKLFLIFLSGRNEPTATIKPAMGCLVGYFRLPPKSSISMPSLLSVIADCTSDPQRVWESAHFVDRFSVRPVLKGPGPRPGRVPVDVSVAVRVK